MPRWTARQVADAAPDEASRTAARRLARPGPWTDTGATDILVWGKCQGSGRTPYQVSVDLVGPAYRCTCPSRKFPCKHALALLMMWVDGAVDTVADRPPEVASFAPAPGRATRADAAPDPAAAAKRLEERLALMDAGMEDFATWLSDLARQGLAAARQQPYSWWDTTAARLVDAQLPGVAEQVREMGSQVHRRADWADHLLATAGRWWLLATAWARRESLGETARADLRVAVGWPTPTAEVRAADELRDRWLVLGAHRTDDGRLQQQRTWLRGATSGETVQVLDFAVTGAALATPQLAGTLLDASVARYPGTEPRRALFREEPSRVDGEVGPLDPEPVSAAVARASARLGRVAWTDRVPATLAGVTVCAPTAEAPAGVVDAHGQWLDLVDEAPVWTLLALTGGRPSDLVGELDEGRFRPLSLVAGDRLVPL